MRERDFFTRSLIGGALISASLIICPKIWNKSLVGVHTGWTGKLAGLCLIALAISYFYLAVLTWRKELRREFKFGTCMMITGIGFMTPILIPLFLR